MTYLHKTSFYLINNPKYKKMDQPERMNKLKEVQGVYRAGINRINAIFHAFEHYKNIEKKLIEEQTSFSLDDDGKFQIEFQQCQCLASDETNEITTEMLKDAVISIRPLFELGFKFVSHVNFKKSIIFNYENQKIFFDPVGFNRSVHLDMSSKMEKRLLDYEDLINEIKQQLGIDLDIDDKNINKFEKPSKKVLIPDGNIISMKHSNFKSTKIENENKQAYNYEWISFLPEMKKIIKKYKNVSTELSKQVDLYLGTNNYEDLIKKPLGEYNLINQCQYYYDEVLYSTTNFDQLIQEFIQNVIKKL